MATSKVPKKIATPKRRFAFDLRKPIMRGNLLKQGGFHKAFKGRYFILYPGFLVYYDHPDTWKYDLQRGETLGSRIGAIKLKGGSVEKAKDSPRGAKYAFVINCPDPSNKRRSYMFNCQSNEERYQWMSKTSSAIPSNDTTTAAPKKQQDEKKEEEPKSKETDVPIPSPAASSLRERQETVDEAALLAVSDIHEEDTKETHIDEVFGPRTSVCSTSSEEEDINNGPEVVSSVSVAVNSPIFEPKQLQREPTEIDIIEIVIPPKSMDPNFSNAVIDPNSLSSDESSDSEKMLTGSPNTPLSPHSTPPPPLQLEIEQNEVFSTSPEDSVPPIITIDKSTLERQPNSATKEEDKENGSPVGTPPNIESPTPDRRRPSGALAFIEKRGLLYKMGGVHKNWHRRFFVLQPGVFHYYKSEPKGKALGEVKLKNTKIILPQEGERTFSSYQFTIHTESSWNKRSDWAMAASNENEMKEWIEAFKMASGMLTKTEDNGSE